MLQLRNDTPFATAVFLFPDARGVDTLYVVVKSTFGARGGAVRVADSQDPVCLVDEYWAAPETSSLRRASEAHLGRPGTDVLVAGHVHAPGGRAATTVDATIAVGAVRAQLRAIGDREMTGAESGPACTPPRPFTAIPLRFERAFGGTARDPDTGEVHADRRNPVGRGFVPTPKPGARAGARSPRAWRGVALPNLEDPRQCWQRPGDAPAPCATGPLPPAWMPRAGYAGTYDARWDTHRAPYLPDDFDARFFHVAPPRQQSAAPLAGGEPCELRGFTADEPAWRFTLPALVFDAHARVGRRAEPLAFALETVQLEPDAARVVLVHRAALPCDKRALAIESVRVALAARSVEARA